MGDDKTEAFASWLRGQGIELTAGERSLVAGFVALAGPRQVSADDIARGTELALDSGISERAQLDDLGTRLLAFEAANATTMPSTAEPAGEISAGEVEAAVPLKIKIRTTNQVLVVAPPAPVDDAADEPATRDAGTDRYPRWRRARVAMVAGGVVAMATLVGVGYLRREAPMVAEAPAPASPPGVQRLQRIALGVRLPPGWRELGEAERAQLAAPKDSIVLLRGATPADPDHGMFVAATAAHGDPIEGARAAERGVIQQLGIAASAYQAAGCGLIALGSGPAAHCRGVAERGAAPVAVEIFVRTVGDRDIVALSLARTSQAAASAEAAAIVASFTP